MRLNRECFPQLVIGSGDNRNVSISSVQISRGVAQRFKDIANDIFVFIDNSNEIAWSIEAEADNQSYLVIDDLTTLGETPKANGRPLMERLALGSSNFQGVEVRDITFSRVFFYAVYFKLDENDECILIKKSNPTKYIRRGRFYTLASNELEMVDQNILSFENDFDFMLFRNRLYIFSQAAFSMMFRGQQELSTRAKKWVTDLASAISIHSETIENLKKKVETNSFSARKIESIVARGHLVGKDVVRDLQPLMSHHGLNPSEFIEGGKIKCEMDRLGELLGFLNEDLFTGSISSTKFIASRKNAH